MKSIIETCKPRKDILRGTFNPEIFTASLSEVIRHYTGQGATIHSLYTDGEQFFREATYPTDGLKMVLSEVFARLAGNATVPAIHRLETAFGGGKTHTLIACAHIGFKGSELRHVTKNILENDLLPKTGEVSVVGIAGDEIPVHKPVGTELRPYTLWGEIAYQIGGESLYREVEAEAESYAAPGKNYFETIFEGRKVLLMLDELAQYAARLSAARPDGGDQLAAFLMALHGYARTNPGIAILMTLASATDAFASQTNQLSKLLSDVTGKEISRDDALGIGQQAISGVSSVVARDATGVVPVQAAEISRVLAKRLFIHIDPSAAKAAALEYEALYKKNASLLPDEATRIDFRDRMINHYPFHPTLIDFLNNKLAASEDFQGTRGVLRILALTVRNIWKKGWEIPMIHTCHIDLRDPRTVNEIAARTGGGDLLPVLNADVGGADTDSIEGGRCNAELADLHNPHPEGWPTHEYTWKTVFLHSLVGREQGLESNLFGLTKQDALFQVAFPGLTPPQIAEALKEIKNSAYYLRFNRGRYYASLDPSVNIALAKIRRSLQTPDVEGLLDVMARNVVSANIKAFHVVPDVAAPEHIPDNQGKPVLALISLGADDLDIEACITTSGPNRARIEQNLVLLLVPDTVHIRTRHNEQEHHLGAQSAHAQGAKKRLHDLARTVLAMHRLKQNPRNYGINPKKLDEDEFKQRYSEREKALETAVTETYKNLWYPSADGTFTRKEIRTAGGEGGASVLEQIRQVLLDEGELVTAEHCTQSALTNLRNIFFTNADVVSLKNLRENFCRVRSWPILEAPSVFEQIIRAGVSRGMWCLFRIEDEESTRPDEFYDRETGEIPFHLDLSKEYSIVTPEGARKRGWAGAVGPGLTQVSDWVRQSVSEDQVTTVNKIAESLKNRWGEVPEPTINEAITRLVQDRRLMAFKDKVEQEERPDLIFGTSAVFYTPEPTDIVTTPAKASEKGWINPRKEEISLSGRAGAKILFPLLRRIGSLYHRGGKTTVDNMDLIDMLLPEGGSLRISLTDVPPDSMKALGEFFEVVSGLVKTGDSTEAYLDITDPQEDCPFVKELKKGKEKED